MRTHRPSLSSILEEKSRNKVGVLENAPGKIIFVVELHNNSFSRCRLRFESW